jgi:hypothetical protein
MATFLLRGHLPVGRCLLVVCALFFLFARVAHSQPCLPGTLCRASAGLCDPAEFCPSTGTLTCPPDTFFPAGSICRASAGPCDAAESCTGTSAQCPADLLLPATTICRAAVNSCDVSESCTGTSSACPPDTTICTPTIVSSNADAAFAGFPGQDLFSIDSGTNRLSFYAAYSATGLAADYSMSISVGGTLALHNHQAPCINLDAATYAAGSLGTTTQRTAFFYIDYNGPTAASGTVSDTNPITLNLFNGLGCSGAAIATLNRNAAVVEALSANVTNVMITTPAIISPAPSTFRIYVDGNAGTIDDSFGLFLFTAAATHGPDNTGTGNWRPDILKLTHTQLCIPDGGLNGQPDPNTFSSGNCTTGIVAQDKTFAAGLGAQDNQNYHVVYEFAVLTDPDADDIIPVTSTNYIQSDATNLTVAGGAQPTPTPTATPTSTQTPTRTATPTPTSTGGGAAAPSNVPTLSPWMLALLGVALASIALLLMRRS